jgi:hypothetical protein
MGLTNGLGAQTRYSISEPYLDARASHHEIWLYHWRYHNSETYHHCRKLHQQ